MAYKPKLNKDALIQGFVGADPKKLGVAAGFMVNSPKPNKKKGTSK